MQFLMPRAMHVLEQMNQGVDLLSRGGPCLGEWRLHPEVIEQIWHSFSRAMANLFAARENTHCLLY